MIDESSPQDLGLSRERAWQAAVQHASDTHGAVLPVRPPVCHSIRPCPCPAGRRQNPTKRAAARSSSCWSERGRSRNTRTAATTKGWRTAARAHPSCPKPRRKMPWRSRLRSPRRSTKRRERPFQRSWPRWRRHSVRPHVAVVPLQPSAGCCCVPLCFVVLCCTAVEAVRLRKMVFLVSSRSRCDYAEALLTLRMPNQKMRRAKSACGR